MATTIQQLTVLCKDPNRKERLKSVTKDQMADILAKGNILVDGSPQTAVLSEINSKLDHVMKKLDEMEMLREKLKGVKEELEMMKKCNAQRSNTDDEIMALKNAISEQGNVIKQQQAYLEQIDARERGTRLVLQGVPIGTWLGCEQDEDKVRKIVGMVSSEAGEHAHVGTAKRIGKVAPGKTQPILATVSTKELRDQIVNMARRCADPNLACVRIKKDIHPSVRAEWKRLFDVKEAEEKKPENSGKAIALDFKKRQVTCDGAVIDTWSHPVF